MSDKKGLKTASVAAGLVAVSIPAWLLAQGGAPAMPPAGPPPTTNLTLHFKCNLGSFKLLPKAALASGHVEITFSGTLLVSGLKGNMQVTGNLNKEYEGLNRVVYFGTGKLVLDGQFRGLQWFGSDMSGSWKGDGVARLFGEFDDNLETGKFWFDNPTVTDEWGTYGPNVEVPKRTPFGATDVVPKRRGG